MPNRRRQSIQRVTITLPEDMLAKVETEAAARGIDRLALMREMLESYLSRLESKAVKHGPTGKN